MAPIRVGLIGLSANGATSWASKTHLPYLLSTSKYELVALCNSSVASAEKAIQHFKLPATVKAYGSPQDLAQDPDVDLAVCATGVEHHFSSLVPLVKAGKDVFTEVPLAMNIDQARELWSLAQQHKVRTMIGMQGQANPAVKVIKNAIESGKIGKVLSITITGYAEAYTGDPNPESSVHLFQRAQGANMMTVWFLHTFNFILHTLGELASFDSMLGISHPEIALFDPKDPTKKTQRTITSDTPDQIFLQGKLVSNALLSFHMEGGAPFPGEPGLRWHIVGEKGELLITNNMMMMDVLHTSAKVQWLDYSRRAKSAVNDVLNDKPQSIPVTELEVPKDELSKVGDMAENVGRLYEAFADGENGMYADWEVGLRRHELMEEMFQRWDGQGNFGREAKYMKADI
ncbi:hypothetical protein B0A48_14217 [Cryoendolithus antarcticus]|uniref:Uncharacterized protein n=1 Tax=Cryoendolithus antarcticus TaxID=1507870 RepID=A0A1V8SLQ5_9PEZI|nr:hypothetical protein B0A48_14217 [Cryoendolithus antarcticus]